MEIIARSNQLHNEVQELTNNASLSIQEMNSKLNESYSKIESAKQNLTVLSSLYDAFPQEFNNLKTHTIEKLKNTLIRLNPQNEEKYAQICENHANDLANKAKQLRVKFNSTLVFSSKYQNQTTENSYNRITDVIRNIQEIVNEIEEKVEDLFSQIYSEKESDDQAENRNKKSKLLAEEASKISLFIDDEECGTLRFSRKVYNVRSLPNSSLYIGGIPNDFRPIENLEITQAFNDEILLSEDDNMFDDDFGNEDFDNLYEYNIERKLNKLKTLINCVEPVYGRDLPKHQFLPSGFLGRKLDREELGVDCDEIHTAVQQLPKQSLLKCFWKFEKKLQTCAYFKLLSLNASQDHYHTSFDETDPTTDYVELLTTAAKNARIIVMCAESPDTIRKIMLTASDLGMTQKGDFVFFSIELLTNHNKIKSSKPWYRSGDSKDVNNKAKDAYQALLIVTAKEPDYTEFEKFANQIREIARLKFNYTYQFEEVLNELVNEGLEINNGTLVTSKMWNRTFQGLTGKFDIDKNGDRSTDCSLLSMNQTDGQYEVVANYYGSEEKFVDVEGKSIQWAGGRNEPPPAIPDCGFDGSKCRREDFGLFDLRENDDLDEDKDSHRYWKKIIDKVKNSTRISFRPSIETDQDIDEAVLNLMQQCWSEDPNERNDSHSLKSIIRKFNK
ncbi:hypothetical protein RND71_043470 [Anisodus tanguticus]|uniref:Receptor ligand binding region domain-containing protein n=1 Tax=Anisodus tanguticus TaxID=243964 RepID=A0AAE1QNM1_9SOLA|nr:hypothetical protein RND71_043470 [Anisodus tanguticus]